jgi:hypothetical protein
MGERYDIEVRDAGDMSIGTLVLHDPMFVLSGELPGAVQSMDIIARVKTSNMTAIVSPFGIEPDALGELIKDIWLIEAEAEVPLELPIHVRFSLLPID